MCHLVPSALVVSARRVLQVGSRLSWVRLLSCSFAAWLQAPSSLLLLIAGGTYCSPLAYLRVQEESTVEVDNVETISFVQNFRKFLQCL